MKSDLPRIAIPEPTSTDTAYNQRTLPQYIHAVMAAGGIAVPIPLHEAAAGQKRLADSCTGILLPGSPADLDPARYGQKPHAETAGKDTLREATDDLLLRDATDHGKPLLGICFGLQSLSVLRHGSLIQHLPQAASGVVDHEPGGTVHDAHPVAVTPGSRLAELVGDGMVQVNSSHHQAVDRPGECLRVAAVSPDGVIEALEAENRGSFLLAVQWHPERTYEHSAASRAIFGAFVTAAREWALAARYVSVNAIEEAFQQAGIPDLPTLAFERMTVYLELLLRWNTRLNLTAVREPSEIIRRHLVECGFFARKLPGDVSSLMDYGTGAGLPGFVVAICRPEIKVTLTEAHARKVAFLREAVRSLDIACSVYHGRVESMPVASTFDVVSMRAVEKMARAIPIALRHVDRYLALLTTRSLAAGYRAEFYALD